jgi:hypothetical protein
MREPPGNPKFPFAVNQVLDFAVGFPFQSDKRPYGIRRLQLRAETGILKTATKALQNRISHRAKKDRSYLLSGALARNRQALQEKF